jgi:uncharacterized protein (TIGR03437 family)
MPRANVNSSKLSLWHNVLLFVVFEIAASAVAAASTPTAVTAQSSSNPAILGKSVTFTATIQPTAATGVVTWYEGISVIGVSAIKNGQATLTTDLLPFGESSVKAFYHGDETFQPSTSSPFVQNILSLGQSGFRAAATIATVNAPGPPAVGDFNGDGKPDLAVIATLDQNISILLGNGDGTFQSPVNYAVGGTPLAVAVGDFNGDGKSDLVVVNQGGYDVSVLLGVGNGTFQSEVTYRTGGSPDSVVVGDFNGDGNEDLAVANTTANNVSILLGNGDGTFQASVNYGAGQSPLFLAAGDFNGDGVTDLAVANRDTESVSVLLGKGDGTLTPAVPFAVGSFPVSVAVGDFNDDGKQDLAVANFDSNQVSVLLGKGDGTFQGAVNYPVGSGSLSVVVGDFNGDGLADLAVINEDSNNLSVLLGNGDGSFKQQATYYAGAGPVPIAIGDLTGDGRTDVVVSDYPSSSVMVLLGATLSADLSIAVSHAGDLAQGQTGAAYSIVVQNGGVISTVGSVQVVDQLSSALSPVSISGVGWNCTAATLTCSRSDTLSPGASYPPISVTVNIAADAPSIVTNTAVVSGGLGANTTDDIATDAATVLTGPAPLTVTSPSTLPSGTVGVPYSQQLNATGGVLPYLWLLTSGTLPAGLSVNSSGTISGTPDAPGASAFTIQVSDQQTTSSQTFTLTINSAAPAIAAGGVVNGASFQPGIASNGWMTISGTNFSSKTDTWDKSIVDGALPTSLDGVSVTVAGQLAYIEYVSPTQINAIAPNVAPGSVPVIVKTASEPTAPVTVQIAAEQPAFFQWGNYAVATHQDFSLAVKNGTFPGTTTVPAAPGDVIILWGTGFGPVSPAVPAGIETPSNAIYNTATQVTAKVGSQSATVYGAALAPGYAGLYQIAIQIPAGLSNGDYPVVATIDGAESATTTLITVQQP